MSDTPETDAEHARMRMGGFTLDFCRKLERERDEAREQANVMHEQWLSKGRCCENLAEELHEVKQQRDKAIARSKEWSDWCVEYKIELEEAKKDTENLSRRMKVLWDSSEKVCRERDELIEECAKISAEFGLPPTIRPADGEIRRIIKEWKQAYAERDEARKALRTLAEHGESEIQRITKERDEARAVAKLAYSILAKVNRRSLEDAAARSSIKHINNTPMEWLYSIIQNWK